MFPTTHPHSSPRAAVAIIATLSLACLGSCSVSVGRPSKQDVGTTASQEAASLERTVTSTQSTAPAAPDAAASDSQDLRAQTPAASAPEAAASQAPAGATPGAEAQAADGDRPGARATITDTEWLTTLDSVDRSVAGSPSMLLDKPNDYVRIEGDVTNLSILGANATVYADYIGVLTISGPNVTVYVKDVDHVIIKGHNADVVWAGKTPKIEDFGSNTGTRQQGTGDQS